MDCRKIKINYKGITIHSYKMSNWAYIGNRPFISVLSAKRHITKVLNYYENDVKKACQHYGIML